MTLLSYMEDGNLCGTEIPSGIPEVIRWAMPSVRQADMRQTDKNAWICSSNETAKIGAALTAAQQWF